MSWDGKGESSLGNTEISATCMWVEERTVFSEDFLLNLHNVRLKFFEEYIDCGMSISGTWYWIMNTEIAR